jgi:hypothetical protein
MLLPCSFFSSSYLFVSPSSLSSYLGLCVVYIQQRLFVIFQYISSFLSDEEELRISKEKKNEKSSKSQVGKKCKIKKETTQTK